MSESTGVAQRRVCVIGLGNVFLGDDGFGCLAVEVLCREYDCGPHVEVVDLGAPGLDLAPYLFGRDLVVLVDAVNVDGEPGTVQAYRESDLVHSHAQLRLTDHDPGLQESLARLRLVGRAPAELIVIGVIPESCNFGERISPIVLRATSMAVEKLVRLLQARGFDCRKRSQPGQADASPVLSQLWRGSTPETARSFHAWRHGDLRR